MIIDLDNLESLPSGRVVHRLNQKCKEKICIATKNRVTGEHKKCDWCGTDLYKKKCVRTDSSSTSVLWECFDCYRKKVESRIKGSN